MRHSVGYTIAFAAAVCVVCAILVSSSAVSLADLQQSNALLDKRKNVLYAAGLADPSESLTAEQINKHFEAVEPVVIELATGEVAAGVDPLSFDQQKAKKDPQMSRPAPPNLANISRVPNYAVIYQVKGDGGQVEMVVLPIEGYGLWSTLYGFLALDADGKTVRGITYYQHGETPGLGGEVDNPRWKSLWPGRVVYDEGGRPVIEVIKGQAGPPAENPHAVDGLAGATITSRGITNMLRFWLGPDGFGPFLTKFREKRQVS